MPPLDVNPDPDTGIIDLLSDLSDFESDLEYTWPLMKLSAEQKRANKKTIKDTSQYYGSWGEKSERALKAHPCLALPPIPKPKRWMTWIASHSSDSLVS